MVAASATCMVNRVGWTRSIPVTVSGADIASVTENPDSLAISGSACGDGGGEHRFGREQVSAHRGPLRTLPGEHPHRSPVVLTDHGRIRSVAVGDLPQRLRQLLGAAGDHGGPHGPVPTPTGQGVGQIRQRHGVGMGLHPVGQPARGPAQFVSRGG